jgi:hypothetical protein
MDTVVSLPTRTVGWLKKQIKHLPDDYPVYIKINGVLKPLHHTKYDEYERRFGLYDGEMEFDLIDLILDNQIIMAVRRYRECNPFISLLEARDYIYTLRETLNDCKRDDESYRETVRRAFIEEK